MRHFFFISFAFFTGALFAQPTAALQAINEVQLKEKLTVLASDSLEGRATASNGQKKAAAYIQQCFEAAGLTPIGANGYQQYFSVFREEQPTVTATVNGTPFNYGVDFVDWGGLKNESLSFKKVVVIDTSFLKDTLLLKEKVNNQLVCITEPATDNQLLQIKQLLALQGAKALIIVATKPNHGSWMQTIAKRVGKLWYPAPKEPKGIACFKMDKTMAEALLGKTFRNLYTIGIKNIGSKIAISVHKTYAEVQSSNVAAMIQGSTITDEYVVLTAHYDHLGIKDGKIYHGADDDGSGTTAVIAMANAFAKAKEQGFLPKRNVVLMTVSGEEMGLWGSHYFSEHPLFPLNKTSVNLNTDMVGRIGEEYKNETTPYLYVIGDDKLSSELATITDTVNKRYGLQLNRKYNDLNDPNRFYYRSDHYNFARKGVPVIFYFNGVHEDYHQPSDTVDKINFGLMKKRVQFIFSTAWEMANRETMLKRDLKPLDLPAR